jgi:uncharacterized alpha-E superfamily protein
VERLGFLAQSLASGFLSGSVGSPGGFDAMLTLFDSTITFRAQYQQSRDVAALVDLLVLDRDNPRSLAWVAHTLRGRLAKLSGAPTPTQCNLAEHLPDPELWSLGYLCESAELCAPPHLLQLLSSLSQAAFLVSEDVSTTYFTHAGTRKISVGT